MTAQGHRTFRLVLYADALDCMGEYSARALEEIVAVGAVNGVCDWGNVGYFLSEGAKIGRILRKRRNGPRSPREIVDEEKGIWTIG